MNVQVRHPKHVSAPWASRGVAVQRLFQRLWPCPLLVLDFCFQAASAPQLPLICRARFQISFWSFGNAEPRPSPLRRTPHGHPSPARPTDVFFHRAHPAGSHLRPVGLPRSPQTPPEDAFENPWRLPRGGLILPVLLLLLTGWSVLHLPLIFFPKQNVEQAL